MATYEAMYGDKATVGMKNSVEQFEATGLRDALAKATEKCPDGYFLRGVTPVEQEGDAS